MFCVLRSLATGANFWVANLKSFVHVLAHYGLLATGHSMDGSLGSPSGWSLFHFRTMAALTRVMDSAYKQPPSSCSSCDPGFDISSEVSRHTSIGAWYHEVRFILHRNGGADILQWGWYTAVGVWYQVARVTLHSSGDVDILQWGSHHTVVGGWLKDIT